MTNHDPTGLRAPLPPLPKPGHRGPTGTGAYFSSYTADQLRAYAAQAVADALRAAQPAAPQPPSAWRPISEAPRGSGMNGPQSTQHPNYVEPPKLLLWTQEGPVVGYYDWYYHPGYGRGADEGESAWRDHHGGRTYGVTHWMPLPPPPSAGEEKTA